MVTCGSMVKITSQSTGYKLHSHGVAYGHGLNWVLLVPEY